jgi:kinesin family protein 11
VWKYADQWELIQNRDTVLKAWRQRSSLNAGGDTFLNEYLPLQAEDPEWDDEDEEDVEAMMVDAVVSLPGQRQPDTPEVLGRESPVAVSLASSASSTSIPITQPPNKKTSGMKSGLPTLGTLTDRPINIMTHHPSRRVR